MKTEPTEADSKYLEYLHGTTNEKEFLEMDDLLPMHDAIKACNIAFQEGQSSPKIKQLEWLDDNFPYRGCSVFVDYLISNKISSCYTVTLDIGTGIYINSFKTIEEAKSAAQRDFEQRVKECLE